MKKLAVIFLAMITIVCAKAQAPQKMSYQSIIRDNSNNILSNGAVGLKISILQGSPTGTVVFVETHATTTNINGLITIEIGGGTAVTGTLAGINWESGPYFLKTEADPTGGTSYTLTTTSQLLSVPYSLHSKTSGDGSNVKTLIYAGF